MIQSRVTCKANWRSLEFLQIVISAFIVPKMENIFIQLYSGLPEQTQKQRQQFRLFPAIMIISFYISLIASNIFSGRWISGSSAVWCYCWCLYFLGAVFIIFTGKSS